MGKRDIIKSCLEKIAARIKQDSKIEIIVAVDKENLDTGVRALKSGVSDFMILPVTAGTFDLYIKRALERRYLHRHLCFNEDCYQSRFAVSQQNYQQLFNAVPCFVFVQDRDYQITEANRKFVEYFGHHIGEYCFGICKNRDEPCRDCPAQKTIKNGTSQVSEMEIIASDGSKHVVLFWSAPIRDLAGKVTHSLVMLTDITDVRRLEDHLSSLGFMIGSISHGIKGLLTSLDGGLYLMESGFKLQNSQKIQQGFEMTREMSSRIKNLVLDILYYTKTRHMDWEQVSCRAFMEETLALIMTKAQKNGITVAHKFETLTLDDTFEIDRDSLQAAMINFLENAIEACVDDQSPSGKQYTIGFFAKADRENIVFIIQDNGLGMDKATVKNIFTIFFSSKGNKGTGLGLFISNKVIQQHRGKIKVDSTKERGSRFVITLPRSIPSTVKNSNRVQ
jgi:PAS domain S-box-containing protein